MRKIAVAVLVFALIGACLANTRMKSRRQASGTGQQELSADYVITYVLPVEGNRSFTMRFYRKGAKQRQDRQLRKEGPRIAIIRADIGKMWTIYPDEKTYLETPSNGYDPRKPILDEIRQQMPNLKQTGTSVVNGRKCREYKGSMVEPRDPHMSGGGMRTEITVWIDPVINLPVKSVIKTPGSRTLASNPAESYVDEFRNIRVEAQQDSLFELPKGYKQQVQPPQPTGMMGLP